MYCGSLEGNLSILGYDLREKNVDLAAITANNMNISFSEADYAVKARFIEEERGKIVHTKFRAYIDWNKYINICYKYINNSNCEIHQIKDNDFIFLFKNTQKNKDEILQLANEINQGLKKIRSGLPNKLIFWGGGNRIALPSFYEKFKINAVMVAGSFLLECIAKCINLEFVRPQGATGDEKTDLKSKSNAALSSLKCNDLVIVHINATDTISHLGNVWEKVKIISAVDELFLKPIIDYLIGDEFKVLVLSDHITSCKTMSHQYGPVEFIYFNSNINPHDKLLSCKTNLSKNCECGYTLLQDFLSVKETGAL